MTVNVPFTGFYSKALRNILSCVTGQELMVFIAVATFSNAQGKSWPGIRALADITTYPTTAVSHLLKALQEKNLVVCVRKNARDPETHQLIPDVYAVNPEIMLVSDPSSWQEFRFRHSSPFSEGDLRDEKALTMPESFLSDEIAQADRITEAESQKHKQRSRITAPEGAATLPKNQTLATRSLQTNGANGGASSTAGSQRQPNSTAQPRRPPGSAVPPTTRPLTFSESVVVNSIRREVPDMGHEIAVKLVAQYGVDKFTAAVLSFKKRNAKTTIARPTGWIIKNLESGAQ